MLSHVGRGLQGIFAFAEDDTNEVDETQTFLKVDKSNSAMVSTKTSESRKKILRVICIFFVFIIMGLVNRQMTMSASLLGLNPSVAPTSFFVKDCGLTEQLPCRALGCAWLGSHCELRCDLKTHTVIHGALLSELAVDLESCEKECLLDILCVAFTYIDAECSLFSSVSNKVISSEALSAFCLISDAAFKGSSHHKNDDVKTAALQSPRSKLWANTFKRSFDNSTTSKTKTFHGSIAQDSRVAIVMADSREISTSLIEGPYASLTAVINADYAHKHGYDFVYYQLPAEGKLGHACRLGRFPRPVPWCKLIIIYWIAKQQPYDLILWVDSDVAFVNQKKSVQQYLQRADYQIYHKDWVVVLENDWTPHRGYPGTTGVFFLKPNSLGLQLIYEWWNTLSFIHKHFEEFYEQDAFWYGVTQWHSGLWNKYISITDEESFHPHPGQFFHHVCSGEDMHKKDRKRTFYNFIVGELKMTIKKYTTWATYVNKNKVTFVDADLRQEMEDLITDPNVLERIGIRKPSL